MTIVDKLSHLPGYNPALTYYQCTVCKYPKPRKEFYARDTKLGIRKECIECYKNKLRYRKYGTVCSECTQAQRVDCNGKCNACNKKQGLKQCKVCGELLSLYLEFYSTRAVCRKCVLNK